jgi:hypothetical protein
MLCYTYVLNNVIQTDRCRYRYRLLYTGHLLLYVLFYTSVVILWVLYALHQASSIIVILEF